MTAEKKARKKKIPFEKKARIKFMGRGLRACRFCGNSSGLIRKYGLGICRRCFREVGESIGFRKF
ncbi:MAG: 30S ribosomal protein S14 [Candidatus Micrarchaeota archaeon]